MALSGFFNDQNSETDSNEDEEDETDNVYHDNNKQQSMNGKYETDALHSNSNPVQNLKSLCPVIDISHINQHDYNTIVYEPSSDSYLLMDCIEYDGKMLNDMFFQHKSNHSTIHILEIGCGSGIVSTHTYHVLNLYCKQCVTDKQMNISVIDIDINRNALQIAQNTLLNNGVNRNQITLLQSDLLNGINIEQMSAKIDIMIFNPPYVPTTNEELSQSQNDKLLSAAWSGGVDGRVIIDRFLTQSNFHRLLAKHSCFYLVTIAMNKPREIMDMLSKQPYNLDAQIVAKKRVVQEMLVIIRFMPKCADLT